MKSNVNVLVKYRWYVYIYIYITVAVRSILLIYALLSFFELRGCFVGFSFVTR